jgi:hypothetical protein
MCIGRFLFFYIFKKTTENIFSWITECALLVIVRSNRFGSQSSGPRDDLALRVTAVLSYQQVYTVTSVCAICGRSNY